MFLLKYIILYKLTYNIIEEFIFHFCSHLEIERFDLLVDHTFQYIYIYMERELFLMLHGTN